MALLAVLAGCDAAPAEVEVRAEGVAFVAVQDAETGEVLGNAGVVAIRGPYVVTRVCADEVRAEVSFAAAIDVSCAAEAGELVTITAPGALQVHLGPASGLMDTTMELRVPAGRWDLVAIVPDTGGVLIERDLVIEGPTEIALDPADAILPERRAVDLAGSRGAEVTIETELVTARGTRLTWPGDGTDALVLAGEPGQRVVARTGYVGYASTAAWTSSLDAPIALDLPAPLDDASLDLTPGPTATWSDGRAWPSRRLTITQFRGATPHTWTLGSTTEPLAQPDLAPLRDEPGWDEAWEIDPSGGYRWQLELANASSAVTWWRAR